MALVFELAVAAQQRQQQRQQALGLRRQASWLLQSLPARQLESRTEADV